MMKIICSVLFLVAFCWGKKVEPSKGEFNSELFEGDIILPPNLSRAARNRNRWPGGVFYYHLTSGIRNQNRAMSAFRQAKEEWEAKTCIKLKERTNERAYVEFVTGRGGCWSNGIGRNGNFKQTINLDPGCWGKGTVVHEIGHALGFWHEQSRPDRDSYIQILWQNIKQGMESQFQKRSKGEVDHKDSPYDYGSVMHYPDWAFAKSSGLKTIRALRGNPQFGQRNGLSVEDAKQINRMYAEECRKNPGPNTPRPPVPDCKDNNQNCRYWTRYCNNNQYVIKNCKKTCRRC